MALGTYNRTKANRIGGTMIYNAKYNMFASTTALMQMGIRCFAMYQMSGEASAGMDLWWGYDEKYKMAAAIQASVRVRLGIFPAYAFAQEATAKANPMIMEVFRMAGKLTANANLHPRITPAFRVFTASINASINSVQTREIVMTFENLVMQPGSVLMVDSENYVIILDGENVIDQYDGDWFEFTRALQGVDVTSGTSGKPKVSILYREQYL